MNIYRMRDFMSDEDFHKLFFMLEKYCFAHQVCGNCESRKCESCEIWKLLHQVAEVGEMCKEKEQRYSTK